MKRDIADDVVTSIRLSREQHAALKNLAASQHRTLSQQVRMMLEHFAAEIERDAA